jgi:hypothetical protein
VLDLLSMSELTACSAIVVFVLSSALSATVRQRAVAGTLLAGWFCLVLAIGATGAFGPGSPIGVAGLGLGVVVPVSLLSFIALRSGRGRALIGRVPTSTLVGVHAMRILGVSFLLLYATKRLSAPFAPVAGWGDIAVGLLAIPLAITQKRGGLSRGWLLAWNTLGLADLIIALALGATSAPGPLWLFRAVPGSAIMTSLPWILIPSFLVPSLIFLHLSLYARLRLGSRAAVADAENREELTPAGVLEHGLGRG